jgi:hypothetical protein
MSRAAERTDHGIVTDLAAMLLRRAEGEPDRLAIARLIIISNLLARMTGRSQLRLESVRHKCRLGE